jgi:DUF4097 and DUF4098 domain-containing protein YvlB
MIAPRFSLTTPFLATVRRASGICLALLAVASVVGRAHAEDFAKSYPIAQRAIVHIHTNDGSVRVTTTDAKQVEFHVEYEGLELNKTLRIESAQQGDKVDLTARILGTWAMSWGTSRRLHIEVRMPKDGDLQIESGDGSVEASSVSGDISVHTADGSIRAHDLSGTIDLRSGDGSITVQSLKGGVRLHTGDGAIQGSDLDGRYVADSGDGRIRLTGRFDALNLKTGDGSIDSLALPGSKMAAAWTIDTGSGSVDVAVPGDLQADLDVSTGDGSISFAFPVAVEGTVTKSQVRGKINGGGQSLSIHTGDGSIRVKQASPS